MAHRLNFTDGAADVFSVRKSMWHQLGTILPEAPTLRVAMELTHMLYEVERTNTYLRQQTPDGPAYVPSSAYVTVRTDTGAELGVVSEHYVPVQNADAFRAIEPLLDTGLLTLETGGVLRKGADAWLLGRFDLTRFGPICREVFADEVVPYALLGNNHSGRRGILLGLTPIRVVCANTLDAAETDSVSRSISVAHTGDAQVKIVEAAEQLFQGLVERHEVVAAQYRTLKQRVLTEAEFRTAVLDLIAPDPRTLPTFEPTAKMAASVVERYERKTGEVTRLWREGKGHTGDGSAWEAYNGAVEAMDHNRHLFPVRSGAWRSSSFLDGKLAQTKRAVLDSLVSLATA